MLRGVEAPNNGIQQWLQTETAAGSQVPIDRATDTTHPPHQVCTRWHTRF